MLDCFGAGSMPLSGDAGVMRGATLMELQVVVKESAVTDIDNTVACFPQAAREERLLRLCTLDRVQMNGEVRGASTYEN
jgi:hypothetical protein